MQSQDQANSIKIQSVHQAGNQPKKVEAEAVALRPIFSMPKTTETERSASDQVQMSQDNKKVESPTTTRHQQLSQSINEEKLISKKSYRRGSGNTWGKTGRDSSITCARSKSQMIIKL